MTILNPTEIQGLNDAVDDEFRSRDTYLQVVRDFGEVRPFSNVVEAEQRHIEALLGLFEKYAVAPPANRWVGAVPRFDSVQAACVAGVQGEIDNIAVYDRVFKTTIREDILAVYSALRSASQDRHLPAFQRCSQGRGNGRRDGRAGAGLS
jgi:hypothetical protein